MVPWGLATLGNGNLNRHFTDITGSTIFYGPDLGEIIFFSVLCTIHRACSKAHWGQREFSHWLQWVWIGPSIILLVLKTYIVLSPWFSKVFKSVINCKSMNSLTDFIRLLTWLTLDTFKDLAYLGLNQSESSDDTFCLWLFIKTNIPEC